MSWTMAFQPLQFGKLAVVQGDQAEYPISVRRLYMALVSAWGMFECPKEKKTLEWLEQQPPPKIYAPPFDAGCVRRHTQWVPVNNQSKSNNPKMGSRKEKKERHPYGHPNGGSYSLARRRNPKQDLAWFIDEDEVFAYTYDGDLGEHKVPLERMLSRIHRVGSSTSMVRAFLVDDPKDPTHVEDAGGSMSVGVSYPGFLQSLENHHRLELERNERVRLDPIFKATTYSEVNTRDTTTHPSKFEPKFQVLQLGSEVYSWALKHAPALTKALRGAVLSTFGSQTIPSFISGHNLDGSVTEDSHLAFFPLADVGHPYARGLVKGLGVALPRYLTIEQRRLVLTALGSVNRLTLGRLGACSLERPTKDSLWSQPQTWTRPSRFWSTVTPFVFERFITKTPNGMLKAVRESCAYAGLPSPSKVVFSSNSPVTGGIYAPSYPRPVKAMSKLCIHLSLEFEEPVLGPVFLGAGRFSGHGVCRPMKGPNQ